MRRVGPMPVPNRCAIPAAAQVAADGQEIETSSLSLRLLPLGCRLTRHFFPPSVVTRMYARSCELPAAKHVDDVGQDTVIRAGICRGMMPRVQARPPLDVETAKAKART